MLSLLMSLGQRHLDCKVDPVSTIYLFVYRLSYPLFRVCRLVPSHPLYPLSCSLTHDEKCTAHPKRLFRRKSVSTFLSPCLVKSVLFIVLARGLPLALRVFTHPPFNVRTSTFFREVRWVPLLGSVDKVLKRVGAHGSWVRTHVSHTVSSWSLHSRKIPSTRVVEGHLSPGRRREQVPFSSFFEVRTTGSDVYKFVISIRHRQLCIPTIWSLVSSRNQCL